MYDTFDPDPPGEPVNHGKAPKKIIAAIAPATLGKLPAAAHHSTKTTVGRVKPLWHDPDLGRIINDRLSVPPPL
jgi:hypothetical protein